MADSAQHTAVSLTAAAEAATKSTEAMNNAARHSQRFRSETHLATQTASGMVQELKRLASAYLSIQGLKKAVDLSDSLVSMRARLVEERRPADNAGAGNDDLPVGPAFPGQLHRHDGAGLPAGHDGRGCVQQF